MGEHKLNFPYRYVEVHPKGRKKNSKYLGVYYSESHKRWVAQRWSVSEKKLFNGGIYVDEVTAAHASDTLARELMTGSDQNLKLNFPGNNTEGDAEQTGKRKRPFDFEDYQEGEGNFDLLEEKQE